MYKTKTDNTATIAANIKAIDAKNMLDKMLETCKLDLFKTKRLEGYHMIMNDYVILSQKYCYAADLPVTWLVDTIKNDHALEAAMKKTIPDFTMANIDTQDIMCLMCQKLSSEENSLCTHCGAPLPKNTTPQTEKSL